MLVTELAAWFDSPCRLEWKSTALDCQIGTIGWQSLPIYNRMTVTIWGEWLRIYGLTTHGRYIDYYYERSGIIECEEIDGAMHVQFALADGLIVDHYWIKSEVI